MESGLYLKFVVCFIMAATPATDDLDAFLTLLESKVKGPFSSLELPKAISIAASRDQVPPTEFLRKLSQVIQKTDKITQVRLLIGLLGLDPDTNDHDDEEGSNNNTDAQIYQILQKTQGAKLSEEWVRIVASLVQGIMFVEATPEDEQQDHDDAVRPCQGEEATKLLVKTCSEILQRIEKVERETNYESDDDTDDKDIEGARQRALDKADAEPTLAPYRYALLNPQLLQMVIPETKSSTKSPHFTINHDCKILSIDEEMEQTKAHEEKEHASNVGLVRTTTAAGTNNPKSSKDAATPSFPGFRSTTKTATSANQKLASARPKSSMFMPRKPGQKPVMAKKTILHTRKAGAAQALLAKGRNRTAAAASSTTAKVSAIAGVRGRATASKLGNNRSKMRMLDVSEVQDLKAKEQQREEMATGGGGRSKKALLMAMAGQKRKAGATADEPKAVRPKQEDTSDTVKDPSSKTASTDVASAALAAYQAQMAGAQKQQPSSSSNDTGAKQDWQQMLQERSNRLSEQDRERVQQFFQDRFNPTPDQPTYKMKLHEEKLVDPNTNLPVKETYYLELDYRTFTSTQSKKIKRYQK